MWRRITTFLTDVRSELNKVSWPPRDEVVGSTWVVVFVIAALAIFSLVNDKTWSSAVSLLLVER